MTGAEVRELSSEEITLELGKLREKLYNLRVQAATEKVEDNSLFSKIRKDVARLRTEQMRRHRETNPSRRQNAAARRERGRQQLEQGGQHQGQHSGQSSGQQS